MVNVSFSTLFWGSIAKKNVEADALIFCEAGAKDLQVGHGGCFHCRNDLWLSERYTLWWFNGGLMVVKNGGLTNKMVVLMGFTRPGKLTVCELENGPVIVDLALKIGWFSVVMLVYQKVPPLVSQEKGCYEYCMVRSYLGVTYNQQYVDTTSYFPELGCVLHSE